MANNQTLINELGLDRNDLLTIQNWAGFDATGNQVTLYARLAMTVAISGYQLRNALGMVAGVPVSIYKWCKGSQLKPASQEVMISTVKKEYPEFQAFVQQHPELVELLHNILHQTIDQAEIQKRLNALKPTSETSAFTTVNMEV